MHAHHSFLTLLTQLPSLLYLLERMSSSLRALLTPLDTDTAGRPQRYSTTVLLAVTGGAVLASALYAHALVRKALLARDAPPSQTDPLAHFNRCLQRRIDREEARKRNNSSSSSSSSSAAPSSSSPAAIDDDTDPESFDIRVATVADAAEIAFQTAESFNNFNQSVGLALEFPDLQSARDMVDHDLQYTAAFVAVRRRDQAILCSVFNHEFDILGGAVGCGPWSTKWGSLSKGVGRRMIEFVVATSLRHGARSLRLNQIAANLPAHSLYTSMGFESREPLHLWSGTMNASYLQAEIDSLQSQFSVRAMTERDLATCDAMHQDALGISRKNTLAHDFRDKEAKWIVTDKRGNICGFLTGLNVMCFSISTSQAALRFLYASALLAYAKTFDAATSHPPELHTCARLYPEVERWLLRGGMKIVRAVNLMVLGEWQPINFEQYIYCPSIMY